MTSESAPTAVEVCHDGVTWVIENPLEATWVVPTAHDLQSGMARRFASVRRWRPDGPWLLWIEGAAEVASATVLYASARGRRSHALTTTVAPALLRDGVALGWREGFGKPQPWNHGGAPMALAMRCGSRGAVVALRELPVTARLPDFAADYPRAALGDGAVRVAGFLYVSSQLAALFETLDGRPVGWQLVDDVSEVAGDHRQEGPWLVGPRGRRAFLCHADAAFAQRLAQRAVFTPAQVAL